jgi:hypothetical protein
MAIDRPRNKRARPRTTSPELSTRRRSREKGAAVGYLRRVYLVLGSIFLLAVLAAILFADISLIDRFAPNIATESMGILLVLVFVHRVLERQERGHRLRGSIGGLRKASRALERLAKAWAELVKGSLPRVPEPLPRNTLELLEPHYAEEIAHCDPQACRTHDRDGDKVWVQWAVREVTEAAGLLNQIIIAYSASLDPAYVEAIDELVDDPFIREFGELAGSPPDHRQWRIRLNAAKAARESHFAHIAAAIDLHNQLARDAAAVRTRRMAPRTGTIGMELPLDHDLRVDADLSRQWWNGDPGIGALRSRIERDPS